MAFKKWTQSGEQLRPDAKYSNRLASKFINCMMWSGKKTVAERIFYNALESVAQKVKDVSPIDVFERAIENVRPSVQIRSKRVGGSNYQVPMAVNPRRAQSLAIRWILEASRAKKGKPMEQRLASEFLDAYNNSGAAVTTKDNVHRMAEANKAFAHFAW
ncbi:MAG TPA: 30S ribosomal protein S7 [Phycisphaerae bacterium]|nr:30S ribosomal protein S7 [Phycisphaerae bacterium]